VEVGGANGGDVCQSNMFWLGLTNSQEADTSAAFATKYFKRFYMFGTTATSTTLSFKDFSAAVKRDGGTIVGSSTEPAGTASYSSDIAKIVAAKPQAVYEQTLGADDVTFSKQFAAYPGANGIARVDPSITSGTVKAMGSAATGMYSVLQYIPEMNTPVGAVYSAAVKKLYQGGALIGPGGATAWAGMTLLASILKSQGTDATTIISALSKGKVEGPQGELTVTDHYATMNVAGVRVTTGGGFSQVNSVASGPPNLTCSF
jgi:ABC-type branched-subunit amino acid transport system substrate-binding protein